MLEFKMKKAWNFFNEKSLEKDLQDTCYSYFFDCFDGHDGFNKVLNVRNWSNLL